MLSAGEKTQQLELSGTVRGYVERCSLRGNVWQFLIS